MSARVIGLLHPGEMGAAIGAELVRVGHTVVWASEGRSAASRARADAGGLVDVGDVASVVAEVEVILSVCPPSAAEDVARSLTGFRGWFVDANAIAPATARRVAEIADAGGFRFVDGSIVGQPPHRSGDMRLYLSGSGADEIGALFAGTAVDARVISTAIGAASALKMAYGGWTKATSALLITLAEYAEAEQVGEPLAAEWAQSQPQLSAQLARARASADAKGWRWVGEMHEIAAALGAAGLPTGFHEAAAATFDRSS